MANNTAFSLLAGAMLAACADGAAPRPNILWITCEDISPHLGCYGDKYAVTPNLDRIATQGVRYTHAFAPIGVCAPSRSCLITGMYPPSIGTHHMRCQGNLPESIKCFPEYLRSAGYYCTNNVKTDYNFKPPKTAWDDSSSKAHWRNRPAGKPFFAVFNFTSSHESQIRLPEDQYQKRIANFQPHEIHDPAKAPIPPYHPDVPEVRRDWARYYDMITFMDKQVGALLKQLDDDKLADQTIVFFFSDHGAGMPRSKRWLYDSSLRVPFIVRFPPTCKQWSPGPAGSATDRLVSFLDFAPTVLSLAGVAIPKHMQGGPFLGASAELPRDYVFGFRDRMDERTDLIRCVRDKRWKYIRNYYPQLPYFHEQHIGYMYEMPTMRVWQELADAGKLTGPPALFMAKTKPSEELYDTENDPHEINNLASDTRYGKTKRIMNAMLHHWGEASRDLGFLPEAFLRTRFDGPPYETVRRIRDWTASFHRAALLASAENPPANQLIRLMADLDPAIRYWAAIGLGRVNNLADSPEALFALRQRREDPLPTVRMAVAAALAGVGEYDRAVAVHAEHLTHANEWVRLQAIDALDRWGAAGNMEGAMDHALNDPNEYVRRIVAHALGRAGIAPPARP